MNKNRDRINTTPAPAGELTISRLELEELRRAGLAGRQLATSSAAARYLQVNEGTLRNWRGEISGPPFERTGRTRRFVRYPVEDLVRFKRKMTGVAP